MMKRAKAGRRVLMGQIATGTYNGSENRTQLFDGLFTTGYRIVEFDITPVDVLDRHEIEAVLSTEPRSTLASWDWDNVQQLAWARWGVYDVGGAAVGTASLNTFIRDENMAIEDLWISSYTTDEATSMNYRIVLEKYQFPAWDGAGILVENLSQAGPQ